MLSTNKNSVCYASRIEELTPKYMAIAMPMSKGSPLFIKRGSEFYGKIFTDSSVHKFKGVYLDKKMEPLPMWLVSLPYDVKKIQQRSFVRLDVALPIKVEYPLNEDEFVNIDTITKDISGGGLQIISQNELELGKRVKLTLSIPDSGLVELDGEIMRVLKPQLDRKLYWLAIKFSYITENNRDKIIKFIFKKQLEQRQKLQNARGGRINDKDFNS